MKTAHDPQHKQKARVHSSWVLRTVHAVLTILKILSISSGVGKYKMRAFEAFEMALSYATINFLFFTRRDAEGLPDAALSPAVKVTSFSVDFLSSQGPTSDQVSEVLS